MNIPICWQKTARSARRSARTLPEAAISKVEIERFPPNQVRITIHSAKPGIIIGRKGVTVNTCAMICSR